MHAIHHEISKPEAPHRVMAYCHDSVGIGHLRRTLTICERVGREHAGASFLLATGTPFVQLLRPDSPIDFIKLPALKKSINGVYESKYLAVTPEQILGCRMSLLLETVRSYEPDLLLVDKAPLGVCRELVPTLRWIKANRPDIRIIFGMRDIEDEAEATIAQWSRDGVQEVIEECYDAVWVYGMRSIFDVVEQYQLSDRIAAKLRYMGYIVRPACHHGPRADARKTVLVTVGGGTDGARVLNTYLEGAAQRVSALGARSIIIGGPDLPAAVQEQVRSATARVAGAEYLDFEPCMSCQIRQADAIVCMGGYNTMCEVATQRKLALVIPRTQPRLEQKIRAERWQNLGVVRMLTDPEFSAAALADCTIDLLTQPRPASIPLALDGLQRVASEFRTFWTDDTLLEPRDANLVPLQ